MRYGRRDRDFDWRATGDECGSAVTRTRLEWTGTTVCIPLRRVIGVMRPVRCMAVEQIVRNVLGDLTRPGRNRIRKNDRNDWNQPTHALTVASVTGFANLPREPVFSLVARLGP
jgi:hypothetical protein